MNLGRVAVKTALVAGLTLALVSSVKANEIKGKVSVQGIKSAENIAVYVDAISDKKFDAPKEPIVVDQRKMAFILAFDQRKQKAGAQPGHLAEGREETFPI